MCDFKKENKPCKNAYKEDKLWFIDIETIEELVSLIDETCHVVVDYKEIIIYDDYLE